MVVHVLTVKHFFEEKLDLEVEILEDLVVLMGRHEVLEVSEDVHVLARVELAFF